MAQLLIRQLSDEVKEGLRERARTNGRSMEAEARAILTDTVFPQSSIVIEYEGPLDPATLLERYGVKVLPRNSEGRTVTYEETQALIDEFV
ncbi:Arc family DNA-binding protein [Leucobacter coleopterorum]|uniref:Arc family DNA-binding protein n=1 Tax=Leucobacter coleopterorum TaxID=2714933 RepID=A0ABX6JYZ9_9MICO|nr:Arc family DNA-binding protein [Leucobacter coleopterorum]QIM19554.1 Arc family DNA-binding protein [Leucobacter coleopterorum]